MLLRILGGLEVGPPDQRIQISAPKQRAVLAALLLNVNAEVPVRQLIRFAWDERPPPTAPTTLHSYIYRLRQLLRPIPAMEVRTDIDSYSLAVDPELTDLWYFRGQVEQARTAARRGRLEQSAQSLRQALAVWRGSSLSGIPGTTVAQEARVIDGERTAAFEELFGAEIMLGRARQVVPELHKAVSAHPFHEVFRGQLMLALYSSGRQTEALQHYAVIRRRLRDTAGVEPGQELQRLHRSILGHIPASQISPPLWEHSAAS